MTCKYVGDVSSITFLLEVRVYVFTVRRLFFVSLIVLCNIDLHRCVTIELFEYKKRNDLHQRYLTKNPQLLHRGIKKEITKPYRLVISIYSPLYCLYWWK